MNAITTEEVQTVLPEDADQALLIGRVWDVESGGPRVVAVSGGSIYDLHRMAGTVAELLELPDPAAAVRSALADPSLAEARWETAAVVNASLAGDSTRTRLLAPVDLQVIKACGVTFVRQHDRAGHRGALCR
ncbi:fumarylacetoacetate (FAA) hydrolase family protein [Arthrobacter sp. B2I5]|nr:fumarylacetoacetate (FAA) hydrolase family protein [Arthrobacter sp. B2I5]